VLLDGVEIGKVMFRKSSFSGAGTDVDDCVEVADLPTGARLVRDSKLGDGSTVLNFNASEWTAFTAGVKAGEFD
jgi:Domain of unknown function (DUF397)